MKVFIALTIVAWFALFARIGAFETGVVAALLSFIGFCMVFLTARHFALPGSWAMGAAGAVLSPLLGALVAQGWATLLAPAPCTGEDCTTVTVRMASES